MPKLKIPFVSDSHSEDAFVFSIEGCNGAGKTTLFNRYMNEHPDTECRLCVPDIYQTSTDIKKFMLYESSQLCSALYYLGGAVEVFHMHDTNYSKVLYDRSVWSTFAAAYAKDETILPILFKCLLAIKDQIFIPNLLIVLDASFETCKLRSLGKTIGGEFDKDEKDIFQKKREFYFLMKENGYPVIFIDVNDKNKNEVYTEFLHVVKTEIKRFQENCKVRKIQV